MKNSLILIFALSIVLFTGCSDDNTLTSYDATISGIIQPYQAQSFGDEDVTIALIAGQTIFVGMVTMDNDDNTIFITIETEDDWYIVESHVHFAMSLDSIPQANGNPIPGQFAHSHDYGSYPLSVQTDEYEISPIGYQPGDELYVAVHAAVEQVVGGIVVGSQTAWGAGEEFPGSNWAEYFMYTIQESGGGGGSSNIQPGDFRTQTMGGWGSPPYGNNPGMFLHNNWNYLGADPGVDDPLIVGGDYTITFENAQAVTDFLPCGGQPVALMDDYVNPTEKLGNLAGQVTALAISIQFDYAIDDFGASETNLGELIVAMGELEGWTVDEVLEEANLVLGGGGSTEIPVIHPVVTAINENFVDGEINNGYLELPESYDSLGNADYPSYSGN